MCFNTDTLFVRAELDKDSRELSSHFLQFGNLDMTSFQKKKRSNINLGVSFQLIGLNNRLAKLMMESLVDDFLGTMKEP